MNTRSRLRLSQWAVVLCAVSVGILGCGKNYYFAGRTLPPSKLTNRVLIAIQNPSAFTKGALTFVDAYYDIRHPYNNINATFSITSASVSLPVTIQNFPEEQSGVVYNAGDGSLAPINYSQERGNTSIAGSPAASILITRDQKYVLSADQSAHYLVLNDRVLGNSFPLNLPGVYRVSFNPGGTIGLAFVQNSNQVYSVVHLTDAQRQEASTSGDPQHYQPANALQPAQDCEPQSLPVYCVFPVTAAPNAGFDRPVKGMFSSDGSTIYVLNCGPECGGTASSVTTIPVTTSSLNPGVNGPAGLNLRTTNNYPVPGGATNALVSGNTMYIAGQSVLTAQGTVAAPGQSGYLSGNLSVYNLDTNSVTATYPIADGTHNKMSLADDNTLFIGSVQCQSGYRYFQNPNDGRGCLTLFNTSTNAVTLDSYKGDLTGIADVEGLHKIYVAEGGQIHIYRTTDFIELDNSQVTVSGTVTDVAYMDGSTDGNNTTY